MALPLRYNFRSLLRRKTQAAMTALGIGLAVLVSVLMLALSTGLMNSIRATGHPLNVLVTSKGAETTEFSAIDLGVLEVLRFSPDVALKDGQPLASPEVYFMMQVEIAPGSPSAPALVRGVLPLALGVNGQVRLTTGRFPNQPGEIMVGALVPTNLAFHQNVLLSASRSFLRERAGKSWGSSFRRGPHSNQKYGDRLTILWWRRAGAKFLRSCCARETPPR